MSFFKGLCEVVAGIPFGENYLLIFNFANALYTGILLAFSITFKPFRKWAKRIFLPISYSLLFLVLFKLSCDLLNGASVNLYTTVLTLLSAPNYIAKSTVIFSLHSPQNGFLNEENRLIEQLVRNIEPEESLLSKTAFSDNPFKRVERVPTQKGFYSQELSDFNLNPSHLEKCINDLLEKNLNPSDQIEAEQILNAIQKYKMKNLSNFERNDFSTNLQNLIKLTAKYDTANFDFL